MQQAERLNLGQVAYKKAERRQLTSKQLLVAHSML